MKKIMVLCCASVLCACAGMNKNTVSYQMSKYDQHAYYVVAGEGPTKEEASAAALANMQKSFWQNVPQANTLPEVKDLMANAKVEKVWKDKSAKTTKNYFALALLKRSTAELVLQGPINEIDFRLGSLAEQLKSTDEKFAGLRAAFSMEPLIVKRNQLQDLYMFVSQDRVGYETEHFELYKKLYNERLFSVKVAAIVRGEENAILLSRIVDAVNKMGLSTVSPDDPSALLSVEVAATSAAVSLRDLQAGTTFARFNVFDRAGTGRKEDSLRKSMEGIGSKASIEIVKRLEDYLKTK